MSTWGYGNQGADRSVGNTDMNEQNVQINPQKGITAGGVTRVNAHTVPDGMVEVEGIGLVARDAAEAGNLPYREVGTGLVKADPYTGQDLVDPQSIPNDKKNTSVDEFHAKADAELDHAIDTLEPGELQDLTNLVVAGDQRGVDLASNIAPNYVSAKFEWAASQAEQVGLPVDANTVGDVLAEWLSPNDAAEARASVIRGDDTAFQGYVSRAVSEIHSVANDPGLYDQIVEAGGDVHNGVLYVGGKPVGTVVDCLINGTLWWEGE